MTKVKLTEAQNVALASYIFHYGSNKTLLQARVADSFVAPYASLNKLSWYTIEQAVQLGWEVIPAVEYNVGDIVMTPAGNVIKLITDLGGSEFRGIVLYSGVLDNGITGRIDIKMDGLRKATKDEVFFAKLGRKLYDFREGDIFVDGTGTFYEIDGVAVSIGDALRWYSGGGDCEGVIPAGAMIAYEEIEGGAK